MLLERNIAVYIVLSIVTCGLFAIYWFVVLADDIAILRGQDQPKGIVDLLLGFITCGIYFIYCMYQYPRYLVEIQHKKGQLINDISVITVVLSIFGLGIVSYAMIQNEVNKLIQQTK